MKSNVHAEKDEAMQIRPWQGKQSKDNRAGQRRLRQGRAKTDYGTGMKLRLTVDVHCKAVL